ncbi:MAG: ABC transporter permease subunit [Anaerolineales bacterium]|nr:ABC transporter permease subunit [Anaerolineales bacterium]
MLAELKHSLRRHRGAIIGWSIGIGLYGLMMVSLFSSVTEIEGLEEMIQSYPPELMAFFGEMVEITTPKGYLDIYYFSYMPLIIGILAIMGGAGLLASDEEKGILDLVMSHPLSRSGLFWGRLVGITITLVVVLLVGWLSWVIPADSVGMDLTWVEFLRPFIPLFATLMFYTTMALLLSMLLPSSRMAAMLTGGILVADFLLLGLASINDTLEPIVKFLPRNYFQGGQAIAGLNWEWLAGLFGISIIFALLAWWRFLRRDLSVGGEGGWRLPRLRRKKEQAATA